MSEMSLTEQIQRLEEMKSYLGEFCIEMQNVMEKLNGQIVFLRSQGFSIETEQTYRKGYYTPAKSDVEQIINDIHTRHIPYIENVISDLDGAQNQE